MVHLRAEKVERIANDIPDVEVHGDPEGELLVVGWGSTYGRHHRRGRRARASGGCTVGHAHLRYLNPLPKNLGEVLKRFEQVLVPEMNLGQLALLLRAKLPRGRHRAVNKVQGKPFTRSRDRRQDRSRSWSRTPMSTETIVPALTKKDFQTDQEVRWCPGCGDYAILSAVQTGLPRARASRARSSWSSPASAAPAASRTT